MKRKYILLFIFSYIIILYLYFEFAHHKVLDLYDSFMDFTTPSYGENSGYYQNLKSLYKQRSSNYLLRLVKRTKNETRFIYVAETLLERKDKRAIRPLIEILKNKNRNNEIKVVAVSVLARFNEPESIQPVMEIVNKFKGKKFDLWNNKEKEESALYEEALTSLSFIQYEPIYQFLKKKVQQGSEKEKSFAIARCLFYYKDHWQEVLPLYVDKIDKEQVKGSTIDALKYIGRPEAIPALREVARADPNYRLQAEEAIKCLESLLSKE